MTTTQTTRPGAGVGAALVAAGVGLALAAAVRRRAGAIDFRDRTVVITGGSRGLGLVLARQLAEEGADLALIARQERDLDRARRELAAGGARVLTVPCDVRDRQQVQRAVDRILAQFGRIDVLINNAGIMQVGPLDHMTHADYEAAMGVHFWGPLHMMLGVLPHMRRAGGGRIVNVTSIGGRIAVPHMAPYTASKFAGVGLSDAFRAELAADKIRVTTVCPAPMRTGSPVNARFKGRAEREYAWFALSASLPVISVDDRRAARKIIDACRYGDAELVISPQARLGVILNAICPGCLAGIMMIASRILPAAAAQAGDQGRRGHEAQPRWIPRIVTRMSDRAAQRNNEIKDG
jgi:NAD(P)-dependent dehydrogenase (short-subunit alcohol dehydrogenase family)